MDETKYAKLICSSETFCPHPSDCLRWWSESDWEEYFQATDGSLSWGASPFSKEEWKNLYAEGYRYCAALQEGRSVAVAGLWPRSEEEWEVIAMGTALRVRGQGYGKAIVSFVTQSILDSGRNATITIRKGNAPMLQVAARVGFKRR